MVLDSPFARKLSAFAKLSPEDLNVISDLYRRRHKFPAGRDMIHEGEVGQAAYILASGWVSSYKLLNNGTRQIVNFQIPGDFLGLRSVVLLTSDHNVEPITPVQASEVPANYLLATFVKAPSLAAAIMWASSRDEAMVVEHLVGLGRRNAEERIAHFLLELAARLKLVGLGDKSGYARPLSQYQLAGALGLSGVHVNRCLRELREEGLVSFQNGKVEFLDFGHLVAYANFDMGYLDQNGPLLA